MANIRERKGKFQVQIRRIGSASITRTFLCKRHAVKWAMKTEIELEQGSFNRIDLAGLSVGDLLNRYRQTVVPRKRCHQTEDRRLQRLIQDPISNILLSEITSADIAVFRDRRLSDGIRTCQYDLSILRHMFRIAIEEWSLPIPENPATKVRKPKSNPPRERRLEVHEYELLENGCEDTQSAYLWPIICLAIETAMRRGELLALRWEDIDLDEHMAGLRMTKNGSPRQVPLTPKAIALLETIPRTSYRVFSASSSALRMAWDRLLKRIGITNLHFHDLRHEAISRFFEMGLSVPEVALISGHKTPSQLFRYTNLRPKDLVQKLSTLTQ
jgi:integrase